MRWIVGDIHGCARELDDLLRAVRFDPGEDQLWSAGDLVNTGPDSAAALRLWRDVGGRAVLGNHDLHALLVAAGCRPARPSDTLDALLAAGDAEALLARLRAQPALAHLPAANGQGRGVWLVHAGLDPRWRDLETTAARLDHGPHDDDWLTSPDIVFAATVRCCQADGSVDRGSGPGCADGFAPWWTFYRGAATVVHGHWATRGHERGARRIALDSGCVYGGPLTAWCPEEDRIAQVPSRQPKRFA